MTSFLVTWFSNLRIFFNLAKAISLSAADCLDQILQRNYNNTIMTSTYTLSKSPVPFGLNDQVYATFALVFLSRTEGAGAYNGAVPLNILCWELFSFAGRNS